MATMGELIMKCFHARTNAHVLHLKTKSYSTHMALESFYEDIVGIADSIAETYQGDYGQIDSYPSTYTPVSDPIKMVEDFDAWIEENRYDCCSKEDTPIQNLIDELQALAKKTTYKLKVLK